MKEKTGQIFSVVQDNPYVNGCTISRNVHDSTYTGVSYFSLAAQTDISAETYNYKKLLFLLDGDLQTFTNEGKSVAGSCGDIIMLPQSIPAGVKTKQGCIYTEISLYKEASMKPAIVGKDGVECHVPIQLDKEEISKLQKSAQTLQAILDQNKI